MNARSFYHFFGPAVRTRGQQYADMGYVKLRACVPLDRAEATVYGSEPYDVSITVDAGGADPTEEDVLWSCTCPVATRGENCKHAWASILVAGAAGFFRAGGEANVAVQPKGPQPFRFVLSYPARVDFYRRSEGNDAWERCLLSWRDIGTDEKISRAVRARVANAFLHASGGRSIDGFSLSGHDQKALLESATRAGLVCDAKFKPIVINDERWRRLFAVNLRTEAHAEETAVSFMLETEHERVAGTDVQWSGGDLIVVDNQLRRVSTSEFFQNALERKELRLSREAFGEFVERIYGREDASSAQVPEALRYEAAKGCDHVRVIIDRVSAGRLSAQLSFRYGARFVGRREVVERIFDHDARQVFQRNHAREAKAEQKLLAHFDRKRVGPDGAILFAESKLHPLLAQAIKLRWEVVAFGRAVSRQKSLQIHLDSGIDWFDLNVDLRFANGERLALPDLLREVQHGHRMVTLADGSLGILDPEVIERFRHFNLGARVVDGKLRLSRVQALFFAAELRDDPGFQPDRRFQTLDEVSRLSADPPMGRPSPAFKGQLRPYQAKALGWLEAMSDLGLGCVLADDMGLGKTICILSLLVKVKRGQSLIVVPKSLLDNWREEATKFTPGLSVHVHAGPARRLDAPELGTADVIVTSYHGLRTDIDHFKDARFEYLILDEAHHIKNPSADVHRACRLVNAGRKIALSGTPIENSLGDLFAILGVVAPGLISKATWTKYAAVQEPAGLALIARALKPFILRRTKGEVLKDLPAKTEQVLYCEMSPAERTAYVQLKAHFWSLLKNKLDGEKVEFAVRHQVFTALLRLRQAASHRNLLTPTPRVSSAKFELLLDHLATTLADGHKVLIFSFFAKLLKLLSRELNERGVRFEYMDGATQHRGAVVQRFKAADGAPVLMMTLKTGGVGLNLAEANYVYILDPWWNPAAEAQAIDRAHRMGQKNKVHAYRLITRDTIEEKVVELQNLKRSVARAVIDGDEASLGDLSVADLRHLLS